jgi:hypothetical protein
MAKQQIEQISESVKSSSSKFKEFLASLKDIVPRKSS